MKMKRIIRTASLLAVLSLVVALTPGAAFADYEYTERYMSVYNPSMVSYSWGYGGDWSVPYLTLSNGWHCSDSQTLYGFTADSYRGKVGYCIAPGVVFQDQSTYGSKKESYFDEIAELNPLLGKDEIINLTGYVLGTAYKGDLKQSYYDNESTGRDAFGHIWAGQVLLWEIITGERDRSFNYVGPAPGCSPCKAVIRSSNPIYSSFTSHYSEMEKEVKKALFYPSFASEEDAPSYRLEWNGGNYSVTLEDECGVFDSYDISSDDSRIRFTRNGNSLTVWCEEAIPETEVRTLASAHSDNYLVMGAAGQDSFGNLMHSPYSYSQSLVFNTGSVSISRRASFYVSTKAGEIVLTKTSSNEGVTGGNCNYSLEGAVYGVYTSESADEGSLIGTITTDENGFGSISEGITAGRTYYVKEISAPKGYLEDPAVYTAVPSGVGNDAAFISSCEEPINDPIAVTISKESSEDGRDVPSLEGTEFTINYYDLDPEISYTAEEIENVTPVRSWIIVVKKIEGQEGPLYVTRLAPEYLKEGSDELYLSPGGEAIIPVGYFTVRETKAAEGYTIKGAKYYSGSELIAEDRAAVIGTLDFDGNISPEGINVSEICVVNDPVDPDSPVTGWDEIYWIAMVFSAAFLIAYFDYERRLYPKRRR